MPTSVLTAIIVLVISGGFILFKCYEARTPGQKKPFTPIICVDFDGVIHSYTSGWKGVGVISDPPVPGAIAWLQDNLPIPESIWAAAPQHHGPIVVIYSSRSKSWRGRRAMKRYLIENGLPAAYIREGILKFPIFKPAAYLTIDDRAVCFTGEFPSKAEMLGFKPWYKRT